MKYQIKDHLMKIFTRKLVLAVGLLEYLTRL